MTLFGPLLPRLPPHASAFNYHYPTIISHLPISSWTSYIPTTAPTISSHSNPSCSVRRTSPPTMTSTPAIIPVQKLQIILNDPGDKQVNVIHAMHLQDKEFHSTLNYLYRHFPHQNDKDPNFPQPSGDSTKVLLWLYQLEDISKAKKLTDEVEIKYTRIAMQPPSYIYFLTSFSPTSSSKPLLFLGITPHPHKRLLELKETMAQVDKVPNPIHDFFRTTGKKARTSISSQCRTTPPTSHFFLVKLFPQTSPSPSLFQLLLSSIFFVRSSFSHFYFSRFCFLEVRGFHVPQNL